MDMSCVQYEQGTKKAKKKKNSEKKLKFWVFSFFLIPCSHLVTFQIYFPPPWLGTTHSERKTSCVQQGEAVNSRYGDITAFHHLTPSHCENQKSRGLSWTVQVLYFNVSTAL